VREPLDQKALPAARAALGQQGIMEGIDYRGAPVVAALRAIPDSPWSLVARMDAAEVYSPLREQLRLVAVLIGALLLGAGAGVGLVWRQQRMRFYQAKYAAEESRAKLAAIVESSEDAIIGKSLDGIIMSWNASAERLFGYRAAEMIGQHITRIIPPNAQAQEVEILKRLRCGERLEHYEAVRIAKDGRPVDVSLTISPVFDAAGTIVGAAKIVRDITERRRLEAKLQQVQKMEAVGQLAGGVAHDYNNILTSTLLQLSMLLDDPNLPKGTKSTLRQLEREAQRAAGLTRQLLLFSRQQAIRRQPLDLHSVLARLLDMLRRLLSEDVQLEYPTGSDPLWVEADATMIEQVITNLCLNAQDAMAPKGGRLTIDTKLVELDAEATRVNPEASPGSFVCLSVTDTGRGMDSATLTRLFEPFFTTKEVGKGTGLGLSIVYGITKQHSGWVEVTSQVGKGSTFRVYLPALAKAPPVRPEFPALEDQQGKETILLVEDEKAIRDIVALGLQLFGYRVFEAGNGPEAIKVWDDHAGEIDLLFTDMRMPGSMTGIDLFEQFKRTKATLKGIISSGYSEEISKSQERMTPGLTFLPKPYDVKTLAGTVRKCLDQASPLRGSDPSG
jgi:PAS domain S-box-containing protein